MARVRIFGVYVLISALSGACSVSAPNIPAATATQEGSKLSVATDCPAVQLPIDASLGRSPTPRSYPQFPRVLSTGTVLTSVDDPSAMALAPLLPTHLPMGLPLEAIVFDPNNDADESDGKLNPTIRLYFSKGSIQPEDTIVDILSSGGAVLTETATFGQDADLVKATIGDAATIIKVASFDAAYVYASPLPGGTRTHNLYWSDGVRDYSLIVSGSGTETVAVADSMFCG
jgi:hypothetical protein